jgi:hypothetical protein
VRFVYGAANQTGTTIPADKGKAFWPISKVELLLRLPGALTPR